MFCCLINSQDILKVTGENAVILKRVGAKGGICLKIRSMKSL